MLGKKASRFHNELRRQFPDGETNTQKSGASPDGAHKDIRDKLRRLLPSCIFVQILAGPPELRSGIFGSMLKLIALTTLIAFPILLLLLLQIQFLPFHDVRITNAQRAALFLDIVLLWLLRPPILADVNDESGQRSAAFAWALPGFGLAASVWVLWLSIVVATIPGEWQENWQTKTVVVTLRNPRCQICATKKAKLLSTHDFLFAGDVDPGTRRRKSLFSNTLVLPGFNLYEALKIDDPKKLAWKEHLFDLRARHLEQAALDGVDLTKADLFGAQLQGASLDGARLQGASLDNAQLQGASLDDAQLQGASLENAQLQGVSLDGARLQGVSLDGARLQGAWLDDAQLQGALLFSAQLQGAALVDAEVSATSFLFASLSAKQHPNLPLVKNCPRLYCGSAATDATPSIQSCRWGAKKSMSIMSSVQINSCGTFGGMIKIMPAVIANFLPWENTSHWPATIQVICSL
jgi:uncharacterized protein YjbI with pentapeptide repeats